MSSRYHLLHLYSIIEALSLNIIYSCKCDAESVKLFAKIWQKSELYFECQLY